MKSTAFLIAALAIAGTARADCVYSPGGCAPLPTGKTDHIVQPTIPANQKVTAADWNTAMQHLGDAEAAHIQAPYHGFNLQAAPPAAPDGGMTLYVANSDGGATWTAELPDAGLFDLFDWYGGILPANAGTGAVRRHLSDDLDDRAISARRYGAKCDGATDDTAAIQAMINRFGGRKYDFAGGLCVISSTIVAENISGIFLEHGGFSWHGTYTPDTPQAMVWFKSVFEGGMRNFGLYVLTGYRVSEGLRMTSQTGEQISSRNSFTNCVFGGDGSTDNLDVAVRIGGAGNTENPLSLPLVTGAVDANNDFHSFKDCTISYYGKVGIYIQDTQTYNINIINTLVLATFSQDHHGTIAASSTTLTHDFVFEHGDEGRVIEIPGAGAAGGLLRTKIDAIVDATHVTVHDAAGTSVTSVPITHSGQFGVIGNSYTFLGGAMSNNLQYDFEVLPSGQAGVTIQDANLENSRGFLTTGGLNSQEHKPVLINGVRANGVNALSTLPFIDFEFPGALTILNSHIGDSSQDTYPIKIDLAAAAKFGGASWLISYACIDSSISTGIDPPSLWLEEEPTMTGCRIQSPGGMVLGRDTRDQTASGATATLDLAAGDVKFAVTQSVTFTLSRAPQGMASSTMLQLTYNGAWTTTWPGTVKWAGGTAPATGANGATDLIEIRWDGTNYYGRVLGRY